MAIPLVDSCELRLLLFVPLSPLLEIVLIMKTAPDLRSTRQMLTDITPFHAGATKLDDASVFFRIPFLIRSFGLL